MAKRNRGIVFLSLGCILILVAGGWYFYNMVEDYNAGRQAEHILERFEIEQGGVDETEAASAIVVDGDAFCGKIIIEKLEVELPVYDEWDYTRLKTAPCRYAGGVDTNDMIIAAHNYKSHFGSLNRLKIGDTVTFTDVYGKSHLFEVCELVTLDGTAVSDMHSGGWDLTLFTCTKSGEQRITVRCKKT